MKLARSGLLVALLTVCSIVAFGEDVTPLPDSSLWSAVVKFIGDIQGTTLIGGIAAFVEAVVILFRTSIGSSLSGAWTLALLYGLSAAAFLLHGLAAGTPILDVLTNAVFTGALLNSGNEIIKHLFPGQPVAKAA